MDIDYTVGEVELSYKPKFKNLHKIVSSEDAYKYLLPTYKEGTICYKEYFKVLFLNQANQVLGYTLISEGGITETCAHIRGRNNRHNRRCQSNSTSCITYQFSSYHSCT